MAPDFDNRHSRAEGRPSRRHLHQHCAGDGRNHAYQWSSVADHRPRTARIDGCTGHVPKLAILVHVEEAFIHCGKALKCGRLRDPEAQIDRSTYPRMGEVMFDHGKYERYDLTREQTAELAQDDFSNCVYPIE